MIDQIELLTLKNGDKKKWSSKSTIENAVIENKTRRNGAMGV